MAKETGYPRFNPRNPDHMAVQKYLALVDRELVEVYGVGSTPTPDQLECIGTMALLQLTIAELESVRKFARSRIGEAYQDLAAEITLHLASRET